MSVASEYRKQIKLLGSTATEWLAYALAIFLVLFPKGGFKVGSIPLTWGYGFIGVALIMGTPRYIIRKSYRIRGEELIFLACLAPLQILFIYSLCVNGIGDTGFALSDIVGFFLLPFAFLAVFPRFLSGIRMERLLVLVRWLVFLAAAYGIFLFVWRLVTGTYIEIPFLTVNLEDVGTLDSKYNSRPGGLFKLISTYNNGNQYGVATLLLLPLYSLYENNRIRKLIVQTALILTLSRTVWLGLIFNEAIDIFRYLLRDVRWSQRLAIRHSTFFRFGRLAFFSALVLGMTLLFSGISFLFDPTLGGRTEYVDAIHHLSFMPPEPVAQFAEIIYLSALTMLGWAGLGAIILLFCSPLILALFFKRLRRTPLQVAALQGLALYIPLAGMDGALNYIPTMAFYWFLWMLLLYGASDHDALSQNIDPQEMIDGTTRSALNRIPELSAGKGSSTTNLPEMGTST